jgi:ABC-type sugar transport system ATPase subunit
VIVAIVFQAVTKRFPGVVAVEDVSFAIETGTCHALCGENGAGKSTLGRVLAGIHAPDSGRITFDDRPVDFASPSEALAAGVAMVHQELVFCGNLSVAENLCLGALPRTAGFLSRGAMRQRAEAMLATIGADLDVGRPVAELTIGQQQMVQIAGAVGRGARVLVFDEPTSSLSQVEAERLYALVDRLKTEKVTSVYVTHRLDEVFRLCDAVTVLRDGRHVTTRPVAGLERPALIEMMIGRRLAEYFPLHVDSTPGEPLLRVARLSSPAGVHDVSFSVRAGEIVGVAGLVGSGRSEMAHALFGLDPAATGDVEIGGRRGRPRSPDEAIARGLGLVPEDRKRHGLVLSMSVLANGTLATLERFSRSVFVSRSAERRDTDPILRRLRLESSRLDAPAVTLSGGNQQKVVLTKWLAARCRVLILDEPTRGVDIGAKAEMHGLIDELAAAGHAVLLISSELPEVLNLSSRILVFRAGRIVGELSRREATQEAVMRLMAGVAPQSAA